MTTTERAHLTDWLNTLHMLREYTSEFAEPLEGKTAAWYLRGPLVTAQWVKNAGWAKYWIHPKSHAKLTPAVVYGEAFSRGQAKAFEAVGNSVDKCWTLCQIANNELQNLNQ